MKIAIIGSRNYTNKTQIKNFMFRLKMEHKGIEIISGGAKDGARSVRTRREQGPAVRREWAAGALTWRAGSNLS